MGEHDIRTDAQPPSRYRCAERDRFLGFRDLQQQADGALVECATFVGQAQAPRPALDQPHAEAPLELGDPPRE